MTAAAGGARARARMGATVRTGTRSGNYRTDSPVARELAKAHGGTPGAWQQRLFGRDNLRDRLLQFIDACRACGQLERAESYFRKVELALTAGPVEPFGPDVILRAQQADCLEDIQEAEYHASPTLENLKILLRRKYQAQAAEKAVIRSIEAHIEAVENGGLR